MRTSAQPCLRSLLLLLPLFVLLARPSQQKQQQQQPDNDHASPGSNPKGHLQPFGASGTRKEVEELRAFPAPADFVQNHVTRASPVKLAGVMQGSRAARLWSDQYLMNLKIPADSQVEVETGKKEDRSRETTRMHLHDFLKVYNDSEYYIVEDVPTYMRPDVPVPCSLQCTDILKNGFAFAVMWFSSGGTKSVVHTDEFGNIICLFRGEKSFVMLDPATDRDKIDLDTFQGFSKLDVDRVDLTSYPGLVDAEFYHVNLTAGDCLFIPYRWIHQVRSYHSNIAVNFWWSHYLVLDLLGESRSACPDPCDPALTLADVTLHKDSSLKEDVRNFRDWLADVATEESLSRDTVRSIFLMDFELDPQDKASLRIVEKSVAEIMLLLDVDKDDVISSQDIPLISDEAWITAQSVLELWTARENQDSAASDSGENPDSRKKPDSRGNPDSRENPGSKENPDSRKKPVSKVNTDGKKKPNKEEL